MVGKAEPKCHIPMMCGRPSNPHMVSEMGTSTNTHLSPEPPPQLDDKTTINLGVIATKSQITAATKSDDVEVPEYMWDVCALGLGRPLKES
jgi:hypothetical protein